MSLQGQAPELLVELSAATKRSFFEFPLCLSRACLDKKITFIHQWLKKWRFFYLRSPTGSWLLECPNGSSSALATSFRVTNEPTAMNEIVIALHIASPHSRAKTHTALLVSFLRHFERVSQHNSISCNLGAQTINCGWLLVRTHHVAELTI